MKQTQTNEPTDPMKVIFNYNNVFFSFFYDDNSLCVHRSREFAMNYVYSGEMILDNGGEPIHVARGSVCSSRATIISRCANSRVTGSVTAVFS